ncbi:MAG: MFS transporter [Leptospirales bacterium]
MSERLQTGDGGNSPQHSGQERARLISSPWMVLFTVLLGTSMPLADTTSMNVGRFFIARALDSNSDETRWLTAGYSLFVAIGIPLSHRLRGYFSERVLYSLAIVVFMAGSLVSMLAHFMPMMMLGRALQGISGGVLIPLSVTLVAESFPERSRIKGLGLFSLGNAVAVTLGPTIGGFLVDDVGWRWTMGIHLPIGFATLFLAHFTLLDHPRQDPKRFDLIGWILFAATGFFFMYAVMEGERFGWHSDYIFHFAILFLLFFFLYLLWSMIFPEPIFPPELFRYRAFLVVTASNFLRSISVFGRLYLLPLFLESFYHFQSHHAGLLILSGAIVELLIPIFASFLSFNIHFPWFAMGGGSLLIGLSSVAYLNLPANAFSLPATILPQLVFGIGMAMVQVSLAPLVQQTVPVHLVRVGNVFQLTVMFLGGMVGTILGRHLLDNMPAGFWSQMILPSGQGLLSAPGSNAESFRVSQVFSYNLDFWIMGLFGLAAAVLAFLYLGLRFLRVNLSGRKSVFPT